MPDNPNIDNHETELRRAVEKYSRLESWCARAVVATLIFEAVVLWWYSDPKKWHETAWLILWDIVLAFAIGGEIVFESRRSKRQADLQRISDQKVAASLERAAEANARAAEANQKAEEARLELAKYRHPRLLNTEQVGRITERMKEFAGIHFDARISDANPEYMDLVGFIEAALERATWAEEEAPGLWGFMRPGKPVVGRGAANKDVLIGMPAPEHLQEPEKSMLLSAGSALAEALRAEGIETAFNAIGSAPPPGTNARIHILIGPKT